MVEESTAAAMKRLSDEMFKGRAEQTAALEKRAKQEVLTANQFKALIKQNEEAAKAAENGDKELIAISEKTQKALDDANKSKKDQKDAANSLKLQREQLELAKKASGFSEKRFRKVEIANAALERQNQILEESEKALKGLGIDSKNNKKHRKQQVKAAKMELSLAKTSGSADAEDEAKKKIRDARGNSYLGKIANGITDIKNSAKDKVVSGAKGLFSMFKKFAFGAFLLATIAFLNSPYFDKMIKAFKEDIIPALTILIDDYIVPFGKFLFGLISGENETIKSIKEFTKGTMFEGVTDGLFKVLGGLVAALSLAVLFKPFFAAKLLVGGAWKLTKLFAGFGKMAATLLGFGKATDAAAKGAAVAAKTAGVATTATKGAGAAASAVKPGLNMPKATGPAKPTKLSSITNAVKDKFTHLKKFPGLLKVANKIPFIGTALSGALLVNTLMDDTKSAKQKVQAVGAVFGGLLGGTLGSVGFGALGAALGTGIFPGIGTVAGGIIGGALGYFGGDWAGRKAANFLLGEEVDEQKVAEELKSAGAMPGGPPASSGSTKSLQTKPIQTAKFETVKSKSTSSIMSKGPPASSGSTESDMDVIKTVPVNDNKDTAPIIVNAPQNNNAVTNSNTSTTNSGFVEPDPMFRRNSQYAI